MDPQARPIVCAGDAAPGDVDGPRAERALGRTRAAGRRGLPPARAAV